MTRLLASIPSPSDNAIHLGPLQLRAYGVAIALGVVAAVVISQRRWRAAGGDPADIVAVATWAVPAGVIGARAYHVITDWPKFRGHWLEVFAIWQGGLGIPGGLLAGVIVGVVVVRQNNLPIARLLDVVAVAIPVAQAIGRLGNWFNQELFGRPTNLPWGLEIDPDQRPDRYADVETFHPTFLYEALGNLAIAGALVWIGRHFRLRDGQLFTLYVAGYSALRFAVESLRVDAASEVFGVRVNLLVSAAVFVVAVTVFVIRQRNWTGPPSAPTGAHDER
jgi:prolipoprotein diacylglyceryl transferase